nr:ABC transporter ATP-binding protein [Bacilli bacterium]
MMRLLRELKVYRASIATVILLIFLQSMANLYLPHLMQQIVDVGVLHGDTGYILNMGAWMLVVSIAGGICSILASYFAAKVAMHFGKDLRFRVFSKAESFTVHEFSKIGTASLITRTTNDIRQVALLINMMLRMMVMAPLTAIGGIVMAIVTDASMTWIIVIVLPILGFVIYLVLRQATKLFSVMQVKIDTLNRVLRERLMGIRVIRAFDRVRYESDRFTKANKDLTDTSIAVNRLLASMFPLVMLIVNLSTVMIIWFGGLKISEQQMPIGSLMAFIQYIMQILFSVLMLSMMSFMIPRASASATRIVEVLDTDTQVTDSPSAQDQLPAISKIKFDHVSFSFSQASQPALQDVSFEVNRGEVIAIIGGTGSGKSTLLNLLMRFMDVNAGSILLDGVDLRQIKQTTLRRMMGYVPQKAVLFSGTIADNIRFGQEEATIDEVRKALDIAQASEFVDVMTEQENAVITQGGTNVSGGQKQRLSIARALVRKPSVYLFDDSFSALDYQTDAKLRSALRHEIDDAIVFIVAQRVATIRDADRIIVLDDGVVQGIDTHHELMQTCKAYQEIVASQLSKEESA